MKKILFIAHSYNDLDHIIPLIYGLQKHQKYALQVLFISSKAIVVQSPIHKQLLTELKIESLEASDLTDNKVAIQLLALLEKAELAGGVESYHILLKSFQFIKLFYRVIRQLSIRLIQKKIQDFFIPNKIASFIENGNIDLIVTDVSPNKPSKSLVNYIVYHIINSAKQKAIKILQVPHGTQSNYPRIKHRTKILESNLLPDVHIIPNQLTYEMYDKSIERHSTQYVVLGDLRYDIQWMRKLDTIAQRLLPQNPQNQKKIVLFLGTNFSPVTFDKGITGDFINKKLINSTLELLKDFPNIEIWIKAHPRYNTTINYDNSYIKKHKNRVKLFFKDMDTTLLLGHADVIISPMSSILFHPITNGKRVVFFDKWQDYTIKNHDDVTLFDNTPCAYRASNEKQLQAGVKELLENNETENVAIEEFYKKGVSGGSMRSESIIDKYISIVNQMLST